MAPKMDPGDLQKRVRKTVGNSSAQKGLLDASGAVKKKAKTVSESRRRRFLLSQRGSGKGRKGSPRLPGEAHLSKKSS